MQHKRLSIRLLLSLLFLLILPQILHAAVNERINARSAILIDMESGNILFEQNADMQIPPASITKVLTLYLVFEAIKEGRVHISDKVEVSRRAASTGGSRMGLKAGTRVPLEELINGMAVVSGNDACVAAAEHISGSVDRFVRRMNAKARELGMTRSRFMTPNGLPAAGQVTTARDISRLSIGYLRRFPESLTIHSMQSYTYGRSSHHNANRLLGKCQGVDGLKTGFVCASGYNISATAKRGGVRVLAVVLGARNAWIRCNEAERLIEAGFRETGAPYNDMKCVIRVPADRGNVTASAAAATGRSTVHRKGSYKNKTQLTRTLAGDGSNAAASRKSSMGRKKNNRASAEPATSLKGRKTAKANHRAGIVSQNVKHAKSPTATKSRVAKSSQAKSVKTANKSGEDRKIKAAKSKKARSGAISKKTPASRSAPQVHASKKKQKAS